MTQLKSLEASLEDFQRHILAIKLADLPFYFIMIHYAALNYQCYLDEAVHTGRYPIREIIGKLEQQFLPDGAPYLYILPGGEAQEIRKKLIPGEILDELRQERQLVINAADALIKTEWKLEYTFGITRTGVPELPKPIEDYIQEAYVALQELSGYHHSGHNRAFIIGGPRGPSISISNSQRNQIYSLVERIMAT